VLARQKARLSRVRAERDRRAVERALARLDAAARGTDNLMPAILEAVQAYATIGEMCDVLRAVFSTYRPPVVV
jgi:methylmalonyl-CoA mutase N-terminal domain/subunit